MILSAVRNTAVKNKKLLKIIIPITILIICCLIGTIISVNIRTSYRRTDSYKKDIAELTSAKYDTVYVSMYDISEFSPDDLTETRLWVPYFTENIITDTRILQDYNSVIFSGDSDYTGSSVSSGPTLNYLLGLDPYLFGKMAASQHKSLQECLEKCLTKYIEANPQTDFYITFPYYSISHYDGYSDDDFADMQAAYVDAANCLSAYPNVYFNYPPNEEWMLCNPELFEDSSDIKVKSDLSRTLLLELYTDCIYPADVSEISDKIAAQIETIKTNQLNPPATYDFSDRTVVILGDSIFANNTTEESIPNLMRQRSGAKVFCYAIGGMSASKAGDTDILGGELELFLNDSEFAAEYNNASDDNNISENNTASKLDIFIEFGFNDFFNGTPVENPDDLYDLSTYAGAIRTAIEEVDAKYPEAEIILFVPGKLGTYVEEAHDATYTSQDYRDKIYSLAEEYGLQIIDLNDNSLMTQDEFETKYTRDFTHYNPYGCYVAAEYILAQLDKY